MPGRRLARSTSDVGICGQARGAGPPTRAEGGRTRHHRGNDCLDKTGDKVPGAESGTSEPKGQELVYAARISLDRTQMQIDDNLVNLTPGMAVTVEIKTGARTVISYLLSPLMRYKQESLRER